MHARPGPTPTHGSEASPGGRMGQTRQKMTQYALVLPVRVARLGARPSARTVRYTIEDQTTWR